MAIIYDYFSKATMSIPILWIIILANALLALGAPKLGHVLFDPLSYEATKYEKLKTFLKNVIAQNYTTTKSCSSCVEETTENIQPKTSDVPKVIARNTEVPEKEPKKVSDLFKFLENALEKIKQKKTGNSPLREGSDDSNSGKKEPCAEYDFNGTKCKIVNNRLLCGYDKNKGELKTDEFVNIGDGCRMYKERIECGYELPPFTNIRRPPAQDGKVLRAQTRENDDLKNIALTVLRAISEHESKIVIPTTESKSGSLNTDSVSSKSTEDITNTTPTSVSTEYVTDTDLNSTFTADVASNSALTSTTQSPVTSTKEMAMESSHNNATESSQNITSPPSMSPELVTIPVLEYLLQYILPLKLLSESSTTTTLAPSTTEVTSDLLVSETAVDSTTSTSPESDEFLTNVNEIDVAGNSSVSTTPVSEVTANSSTSRSPKIVRRSADISSENTTDSSAARQGNKPSRWCVEKGDRIVCYYADNSFVLD